MLKSYAQLFRLLDAKARSRLPVLLLIVIASAAADVIGVASVMPLIAVFSKPEIVQTNPYLKFGYDSLGFESRNAYLYFIGFAFFGVLLLSLAVRALGLWAQLRFSFNRSHAWSVALVNRYLRQPYDWFLNRHTANLATSVLQEVNQVMTGALTPAIQVFAHSLVAVALIALLFLVDPTIALVVSLVIGGGYAAMSAMLKNRLLSVGEDRLRAQRARTVALQETFAGIKDIKFSGLEESFLGRFSGHSRAFVDRQISAELIGQLPSIAMQALLFGGMILIILQLLGRLGGMQEALPVLSLYAFAGYRLMPSIQKVYEGISKLRFSQAALNDLAKDLAEPDLGEVRTESETDDFKLEQGIYLDDVTYSYPSAPAPALDRVALEIPLRTTVGIIGPTGSGKTTLVDVVLGLLRPSGGELRAGVRSISPSNVRRWQRMIGYVPQQIFLADDTVAANIAFGVPPKKVDMQAVERAARAANLHDFIVGNLAQGYDTAVGERGVRLSGGQRQRIAIARALYHEPEILILDEATSALDNLTEQAVMDAVNSLARRKTIIMIAHRLSTVRRCDRIFLLDRGRLAAAGSYDELLATNERFRRLAQVPDGASE